MDAIDNDDRNTISSDGGNASNSFLVLDATSEYCRNLGEIPTYGLAGNRIDAIDIDEIGGGVVTTETSDKQTNNEKVKLENENMDVDSDNDNDERGR